MRKTNLSHAPAASEADPLVDVVLDLLRALGAAGEPARAGELAGRAYIALRRDRPEQADRINRVMHRLARQEIALEPTTKEPARAHR